MFNPDYKSPRSVQMNIGIQHELRRGMVFSVDYARNVQTHYLLGVDQNHAGDIRYFNLAGAQAAIANTLTACGAADKWGDRRLLSGERVTLPPAHQLGRA